MKRIKRASIISLTKGEEEWAVWALDAMEALPEEDMLELWGEVIDFDTRDVVSGRNLYLDKLSHEQIDDLLFRLEEQAQGVSETDAISEVQVAARWRPAKNLAEKIRNVYANLS